VTDRQLPILEEIFLDHLAHFVPDPQAASRALARAGFAPTPISPFRSFPILTARCARPARAT